MMRQVYTDTCFTDPVGPSKTTKVGYGMICLEIETDYINHQTCRCHRNSYCRNLHLPTRLNQNVRHRKNFRQH